MEHLLPRWRSLALLAAASVLVAPGELPAQTVYFPGTWFDQDKSHEASERFDGGTWRSNWFGDVNINGLFDVGEPWDNLPPLAPGGTNWLQHSDASCWAATAANVLRSVGGPNLYIPLAFSEGVIVGSDTNVWTANYSTTSALEDRGYGYVKTRGGGTNHFDWANNPAVTLKEYLLRGLPASIGVVFDQGTGNSHALALYGVDVAANKLIIADSDRDNSSAVGGAFQSADHHELDYRWNADGSFEIDWTGNGFGGSDPYLEAIATFETRAWQGSGTGGMTSTNATDASTHWDNVANWAAGAAPDGKVLPEIVFENAGRVFVRTDDAAALRALLRGEQTSMEIQSNGVLHAGTVDLREGAQLLVRGTVRSDLDVVSDGILTLDGGALSVSNSLFVGCVTTGRLVQTSGNVTVGNHLHVGFSENAEGTYIMTGGALEVGTNLVVGALGLFQMGGGTVTAGALVASNETALLYLKGGTLITRASEVANGQNPLVLGSVIGTDPHAMDWFMNDGVHSLGGGLRLQCSSRLVISNGATALASNVVVGTAEDSGDSRVTVHEGSLVATNVGGAMELRRGALELLGGNATLGALVATNASGTLTLDAGNLSTGSATISNSQAAIYVGNNSCAATWRMGEGLHALAGDLTMAQDSGSRGIVWLNGGELRMDGGTLRVGASSFGALIVSNGRIFSASASLGVNDSGRGAVALGGTNALWSNTGDLRVGLLGRQNQLVITNGARVEDEKGTIGNGASSDANSVLVTGDGSRWLNRSELNVGGMGSNNTLTVSNGGVVTSPWGYLARSAGSAGNTVTISGSGSVWSNAHGTYLGYAGAGNTVTVTEGGLFAGGSVYVGVNAAGNSNNALRVTGAGSEALLGGIYIGHCSDGNTMRIEDGGRAVNTSVAQIGLFEGSNNMVTVQGGGSAWQNAGNLSIGYSGSRNSLTIANGARVDADEGIVGDDGSFNRVTVSGVGSVWSNDYTTVGYYGSGNQMLLAGGGLVEDVSGYVGYATGSTSNSVLVSGDQTTWRNRGSLWVGWLGAGNSLMVSNGGLVTVGADMYVGEGSAAFSNSVTVAGGSLVVTNSLGGSLLEVRRGTLRLSAGLVIADTLVVTNGVDSVLQIEGGTLKVRRSVVGGGQPFTVGENSEATLRLDGGSNTFLSGLALASNGTLAGSGRLIGDVTSAGRIAPGSSPGTLEILGDLILTNTSVTEMEIAGTTTNLFDRILVNGIFGAGGTLNVTLLDGFAPALSNRFDLFDFAVMSNAFDSVNLPGLGGGLTWDTGSLYATGSLLVVPIPEPGVFILLLPAFTLTAVFCRNRRRVECVPLEPTPDENRPS